MMSARAGLVPMACSPIPTVPVNNRVLYNRVICSLLLFTNTSLHPCEADRRQTAPHPPDLLQEVCQKRRHFPSRVGPPRPALGVGRRVRSPTPSARRPTPPVPAWP